MSAEEGQDPPRKKRPKPPTPEQMAAERASSRRNGFIVFAVLCVIMPTLFIINLLRDRNRQMAMMPSTVPSASASSVASPKVDARVLDNEDELTVTPVLSRPSPHDVAFSIGSVLADARACLRGGTQSVQVTWQVNPDGSATDVKPRADGGSEEGFACVAAAVKQARVAPFEMPAGGGPLRVTYTFRAAPR